MQTRTLTDNPFLLPKHTVGPPPHCTCCGRSLVNRPVAYLSAYPPGALERAVRLGQFSFPVLEPGPEPTIADLAGEWLLPPLPGAIPVPTCADVKGCIAYSRVRGLNRSKIVCGPQPEQLPLWTEEG